MIAITNCNSADAEIFLSSPLFDFFPDEKEKFKILKQCPSCQADWSFEEVEDQKCNNCGHPQFDELQEEFNELCAISPDAKN